MPGGAAATTPLRERSRQLSSEMTGSVEDHFTQVSIQLGLAVHAALEAVRENKSLRMAGYWWQWLEDTWVRYDAAYTLYASKLKEASLEVEAYWVRGRKDYKGAREPLEGRRTGAIGRVHHAHRSRAGIKYRQKNDY